uniref:Uncharacterized protein n=1 Tax=Neogobius melanostomus TaxID=47308 RepID=A0A8C6SI94_9GOBI
QRSLHNPRRKCGRRQKHNRRQRDQKRARTRVNIGGSYERWKDLRDRLGYSLNSDLAVLLLDRFIILIFLVMR